MIWYDKNSGKNKNARKEYFVFTAGERPYAQVDSDEGFRLFVERVERVIESENAFTLQVLSTVPDTESQQQRTTTQ